MVALLRSEIRGGREEEALLGVHVGQLDLYMEDFKTWRERGFIKSYMW